MLAGLILVTVYLSDANANLAVATIVSSLIAGGAAIATARSSAKSSVRTATVESRTDIEKEAFDRAKAFYTDTIDRQDRQIQELRKEVDDLEREVETLKHDRANDRRVIDEQARDLEAAKKALALKFPDEP